MKFKGQLTASATWEGGYVHGCELLLLPSQAYQLAMRAFQGQHMVATADRTVFLQNSSSKAQPPVFGDGVCER